MKADAAPRRLMVARSLAWAVHTSGWLVLGAAGSRYAPLWLAGLLPAALWLGLLAYTLQTFSAPRLAAMPARRVRLAWLLAALLLLAAVTATSPGLLALAWAAASAAAGWTVRLLRSPGRSPVHQTLLPAAAGVLAGGCLGLPLLLGSPALAALVSPVQALWTCAACAVGATLTLGRQAVRQACRWGAVDEWRGLQGLQAGVWRAMGARADLPVRLSVAAMLPMMAGLPTLLALCTPSGNSARAVMVAHLATMVLPGAVLSCGRRPPVRLAPALCAALLIAGGLALLMLPLLQGLMWATLLHTSAWSIAWAGGLQPVSALRQGAPSAASPPAAALAAAGGVLAVGWALTALGPAALGLAHAGLAVLALAWAARGLVVKRCHGARPRGREAEVTVQPPVRRAA